MLTVIAKVAGLALTVACCWLASRSRNNLSLLLIWGAPLLTFPISFCGRRVLDAGPATKERAERVNIAVHYAMGIALGCGIFPAVVRVRQWPGPIVPLPQPIGYALFLITGFVMFLTVINLAIRGLGAPFAIKLSSRLAADWMYAWTRNPMLLCALAWFLSMGLWYRSLWFVVWVAAILAPGWIWFIPEYEERELEIRFGPGYLAYKARTPLLWPRRPRVLASLNEPVRVVLGKS
jgi:protein-S-isoprenylcysteine O-methyltransferase Ste14